ncbi:hypothetical protein HYN49_08465 [Flavobacterium pallidum]|uniref:Uncharacterized protein n=2 Tax=Flavobacterium pallidum TaxID=2172098 RepID=A0A2S1SHT6_9FLAO|nr:hypothetical protein HYN49_08465 [Flavobacterium pallidum]
MSATLFAQAPQKMSYQSVIRNASGDLITETPISVRISIVKNDPAGIAVYVETHATTTNENGLASLEIGAGTPVTGTFSGINWGGGNYFIKTETDPEGGSNYSIVGTSQLLSVPYALYSGTSLNQGKSTIYITGDITDEEAAEQIAQQFGTNTESITIEATTQLTTVDLSMATKLLDLTISDNTQLVSVDLSNLTAVFRDTHIHGNNQLTSIDFSSLAQASRDLHVDTNISLTSLAFPALTKINGRGYVLISTNYAMTSLSFPALTKSTGMFNISGNTVLGTIDFSSLVESVYMDIFENEGLTTLNFNALQHGQTLQITNNNNLAAIALGALTEAYFTVSSDNLSSINMPLMASGSVDITGGQLTEISLPVFSQGDLLISGPMITSLDIPSLTSCGRLSIGDTGMNTINLPGITTVTNQLDIGGDPDLTAISLPNLTSLAQCYISGSQLSSISFPQLQQVGSAGKRLVFSYSALPSSQINYLLNKVLNAAPASGKYLQLQSQTPPAPPTGQGIVDKQAMISAGNTVQTD